MRRTKFPITSKSKEPPPGSFFKYDKHLIETYGHEVALFVTNLIDKYYYFKKKYPENNGTFFLTHAQQTKQTGLSDHKIRKCKRIAILNRLILDTNWKGSPAKEWYEINLQSIDIQRAMENLESKPFKSLNPYKNNINKDIIIKDEILENSKVSYTGKVNIDQFARFWQIYPNKKDEGKAKASWIKLCASKNPPDWSDVAIAIRKQSKTKQWQDSNFIPSACNWLDKFGWLNDPEMMTGWKDMSPHKSKFYDGREYKWQSDGTYRNASGSIWHD
jgi:hypothetical protein